MKNHLYFFLSLLFINNIQIQAQVFTDTQGQLNISNSGTASYTLPIALPPSIQNVGPIINLNYNSGQLGGIAGQGWNISGISSIHRIATRMDIDGFIDGVDFDDNDKLALDGQRLILKTGTYWENGSTYETEVQSNTKIELLKSGGIIYFKVTTADGGQMWYGKSFWGNNGIDATAYYIVRQEDVNGNYILYDYTLSAGNALYISEIKFSGNKYLETGLLNKVKFNYESAQRAETAYVNGIKVSKDLILKNVEVFTNEQLFRRYELTHTTDSQLGYQYVTQVQEFNGAGEGANPVLFDYNTTLEDPSNSETVLDYQNNLDFGAIDKSGDFDGDGRLDFTVGRSIYTKIFGSTTATAPIIIPDNVEFVIHTLNPNNKKVFQNQSMVTLQEKIDKTSDFSVYNISSGSFYRSFTKTSPINYYIEHRSDLDQPIELTNATSNSKYCNRLIESPRTFLTPKYTTGDFNGDGITEVLISTVKNPYYYLVDTAVPAGKSGSFSNCNYYVDRKVVERNSGEVFYLMDMNPEKSTTLNSNGLVEIQNNSMFLGTEKYAMDFNGDGKTDMLLIKPDRSYKIVSFNKLEVSPWYTIEVISEGTIDAYSKTKQILFGDYNGDGKTDILLPDADLNGKGCLNCTYWHLFLFDGIKFQKESHHIVEYYPSTGNYGDDGFDDQIHRSSYYAMDANNDGKTDLVRVWMKQYKACDIIVNIGNLNTCNNYSTKWTVGVYTSNIGSQGQAFINTYGSLNNHDSTWDNIPVSVPGTYEHKGVKNELALFRPGNNKLTYIDFKKNVQLDAQLKKVRSSFDKIIDEITYMPLEPVGSPGNGSMNNSVYSSIEALSHPYVEIKRMPQSYVVTQHKNTAVGFVKYMDFRYHGLAINLQGMGVVGYKKTARSAWYTNASDAKIWSVTETDPLQRGAITRQYTQLVGSGQLFSFTYGTLSNLVSLTQNTYESNISPTKVYSLLLKRQNTRDYLTNFVTDVTNTYEPEYNLLSQTVGLKFTGTTQQSRTTTINQYDNNPTGVGANYYIGRLKQTNTTVSAYSDTKISESKYTYTNNRVSKKESKANNTDNVYLTQEYTYDTFGNVLSQTTSAPGAQPEVAPRTVRYSYDASGRYIKTSTDVQGLITTNDTYHPLHGMVTQSTNPYGQITKSSYDNWGKVKTTYDYLGKRWRYEYTRYTDNVTINKNHDSGVKSITTVNFLGQVLKEEKLNIDGQTWDKVQFQYDYLGRQVKTSEPYNTNNPSLWNITEYDVYGQVKKITESTGKEINYNYTKEINGFKVTVNDGIKETTSLTNSNGHTLTSTDPGGAITYTYFADGNLKTSSYEGNIQSITYDDWGRKKQLVDPSAGTYSYSYNAYGEILQENTPLGATVYILDDFGRVIKKINGGSNVGITSDYTYDTTTKLLTRIDAVEGGSNISAYTYEYDTYKRPKYITERTPYGQFNKFFTYDEYGRLFTESYSSRNLRNNKYQSSKIRNIYKNGYHWQILDDATSKVLYQVNNVNSRDQLVQNELGNQLHEHFSYDNFGNSIGMHIDNEYDMYVDSDEIPMPATSTYQSFLSLSHSVNPITGNLINRKNLNFGTEEVFTFEDNFDRLTSVATTLNQVIITTQTQAYDNTGRITDNSQIGSYLYGNTAKKYQVTGITLNTQGGGYANPSLDLTVSYNSFKAPYRINQRNKETLFFAYNTFEQRSSMFYGDTQEDKDQKAMRKHYSHDGVQEITDNIATDQTSFVIYIGGDAYNAPIILKGDGTTKEYLYLHRDYQGSIMAISNEAGNFVEQRLYDAWGLLKGVKDGQGNNLSKLTVLDRGYTGHEHLQGIGLIHMNARLYDPVVHRFMGPDNFVQDPSNTQNYNRYGYVLNNPLKYTDPSGEMYNDKKIYGNCDCPGNFEPSTGQQQAGGNALASAYNFFKNPENAAWASRNLKEAGDFIGRNAESVGGFFQSQFNSVSGWFKSPNVPDYSALNQSVQVNNISTFGGGKIGTYQGGTVSGGGIGTSILDNFQTTLDVAGIADPTGIVDGVNALIYAGRGQWGNAGISAMGIIPYVGDAGKALRLQSKLMSKGGKELFNFSTKAAEHMANTGRVVPVQILEQAIKGSKGIADPRGSRAFMHTTEMWKNGKAYNLEVLYDKASNSIWHFKYWPK